MVAEHSEVVIGRVDGDHVTVQARGRMHPGARDFWDGNWLVSLILARLGAFTAELATGLRADELQSFRAGLEHIDRHLHGEAVLSSIERWISLKVRCQPNGSLLATGELDDGLGSGNVLTFAIAGLDQTDLPGMIDALTAIEQGYPLLGKPWSFPTTANSRRSHFTVRGMRVNIVVGVAQLAYRRNPFKMLRIRPSLGRSYGSCTTFTEIEFRVSL